MERNKKKPGKKEKKRNRREKRKKFLTAVFNERARQWVDDRGVVARHRGGGLPCRLQNYEGEPSVSTTGVEEKNGERGQG